MFTAIVNEALFRLGLNPRGTAPFPRSMAPMLMHKADRLVSSPDWTYEPKWDGFRVIATTSPSSTSDAGKPRSASETAPNNLVNECPFLERRRTDPSRTVAITRNPSHFGS